MRAHRGAIWEKEGGFEIDVVAVAVAVAVVAGARNGLPRQRNLVGVRINIETSFE